MDNFSCTYEKLIDMGFSFEAIDNAIKKGFYTFDKIFNELVEVENSRLACIESDSMNQIGYLSHPVLKLRSNTTEGKMEGNVVVNNAISLKETSRTGLHSSHPDYKSLFSHLSLDENNAYFSVDDSSRSMSTIGADKFGKARKKDEIIDLADKEKFETKKTVATKEMSSTFSSSLLSNSDQSKKMTKIQIMDLLDPNIEPMTYSHPFLSSVCTIRDLICWFQQCRDSMCRMAIISNQEAKTSRFAISSDTNLSMLIEKFQQLKWHLVMPSGAQSLRIHGNEYLDRTLESLALEPSAHLLAIVSCPSGLQRSIDTKDSKSSCSASMENQNQSSSLVPQNEPSTCTINIRMINYRNNPLYFQGKISFTQSYDPSRTTLQRVAVDFSCFCEVNIASFTLLHMQTRTMFSYPDDYLQTLSELGLSGNVTLYSHSVSSLHRNLNANSSNCPEPSAERTGMPVIELFHPPTDSVHSQSSAVLPFSGVGISLPGSHVNKTVAQIWADISLKTAAPPNVTGNKTIKPFPKDLFSICFKEMYRSLKSYNSVVCRSIKKLPNNIQQTLIKRLLEDQSLNSSLLAYFCAPGTFLTSLDLSYTILATNEVLKCVSKCSNLQELILDNEDHVFSNEGLWHLRNCSNLRRLSLNYCSKINDWGIQVVGVLPALSVLAIKYTAVTNVGLKHIYLHFNAENEPSVCPALRSVDLSGLAISDECLSCIGIFAHLELLNLASTHITNPALFPRLPELRHLDISHCYDLVWEKQVHIKSLSECFPKLTSINVRSTSNSNLVLVSMAISHCKHLRQIDGIFCHPQMTASLVASLSHLPLQTIILTNCRHVTDLWLPVLARFSSTLTHLVLSSCPLIVGENNSLVNNLSRLRNLSWLDLSHLENVQANQIFKLVIGNYFSKLQVLWISLTEEEEIEFRYLAKSLHFKVNVTRSLINPLEIGLSMSNN